ncbi:MAG: glucose 1-dehydrogenase [Deltaproteobacteria bacterium]|nr:glucose 1-dehydrogenase [Deltaproteobacteria bacterium]
MRTPELFDLTGKRALVTGGGRGLGRHIAIGLAEAGAEVLVASRKLEACEAVAREICEAGGKASAHEADIAEPSSVDDLVETAFAGGAKLDILVNNAARVWAAPILDYTLEAWDKVFDLNVRGLFHLSRLVARQMKEIGGGAILHISSISAFRGAPDAEQPVVAYNASKGAVTSLTIDMAVKLAPFGIRVNAIAPGPFMTDMMDRISHDEEKLAAYDAQRPLGRSGRADDIKGAAVFLVSPAAAYVTGQTLIVDGGTMTVGA